MKDDRARLRAVFHSTELGHFSGAAVFKSVGRCSSDRDLNSARYTPAGAAAIHQSCTRIVKFLSLWSAFRRPLITLPLTKSGRQHVAQSKQRSPPFCGTQLAEICGVKERVPSGAPRLSAPYSRGGARPPRPEGPPEGKRLPGAEGPPEGKLLRRPSLRLRRPFIT